MKTKELKTYLQKRLIPAELAEIEQQVEIEYQTLRRLQEDVTKAVMEYMKQEEIGFNEFVRRLGVSPSQAAKIQKGEANLTLASLAHMAVLFKKQPHLTFGAK